MFEHINDRNGLEIAVILRKFEGNSGIAFGTQPDAQFQLGVMRWVKEHHIPAHVHRLALRTVERTCECIFVRSGLVSVTLLDDEGTVLGDRELGEGDVILFLRGGHSFTFLQESELVEVKQGPYLGLDDKVRVVPKLWDGGPEY